jgi:hypothetical protein
VPFEESVWSAEVGVFHDEDEWLKALTNPITGLVRRSFWDY